MSENGKANLVLAMNTLAFAACFAVWTMYGVLITYIVDNRAFPFDKAQMGLLIGVPILTGSLFRLPAGLLADRFGGRPVFTALLLLSAGAVWLTSLANSFTAFVLCGLGFGLAGSTFAVGVAYTAIWFPPDKRGTALGIFGVGNVGAGLASLLAPKLLARLTGAGVNLEGWRSLPRVYAAGLVATAVVYWLATFSKRSESGAAPLAQRLKPLGNLRVWRFGLYYFLVFGGFVALASWLIAYYVNVYGASVATAGALAAIFSIPTALIRAFGGWLSDRLGARRVMTAVLTGCTVVFLFLGVPRMDVFAPGEGVQASAAGIVERVGASEVVVSGTSYALRPKPDESAGRDEDVLIFPTAHAWQEPSVKAGDRVVKKQLLARGVTHIYFQANMGIFTGLAFLAALFMGIGMAAVFKHIADYFPKDVGTVGGLVGVIGGLGGFFGPVIFGAVLKATRIWTTCWLFLFFVSLVCLVWMRFVVRRVTLEQALRDADRVLEHAT